MARRRRAKKRKAENIECNSTLLKKIIQENHTSKANKSSSATDLIDLTINDDVKSCSTVDLTIDGEDNLQPPFEPGDDNPQAGDYIHSTPVESCDKLSLQPKSVDMNQSTELFSGAHSDEEFEDFMSSFPAVSGSQPQIAQFEDYNLPDHVLENIFCYLPGRDMIGACSLVCSRWNQLISNEQFMPWKKLYLKIRNKDEVSYNHVISLLREDGPPDSHRSKKIAIEDTLVMSLVIRLMGAWRPILLSNQEAHLMLGQLRKHPLCELASQTVQKQVVPNVDPKDQNPTICCWILASAILMLSSDLSDLQELMKLLLEVHSLPVVMDFFYAAATYSWVLYKEEFLCQQAHYRIYCFVSSKENTTLPLPQAYFSPSSSLPYKLTHEQKKVASHTFLNGDMVRVVAYAGTGKTSTLVACVKANPHLKFLYTSFGRSVIDQSAKMFQEEHGCYNVDCKTMHGLAYTGMNMQNYKEKLTFGSFRSYYVREKLKIPDGDRQLAELVLKTIKMFIASSDTGLYLSHVPRRQRVEVSKGHWEYEETPPKRKKKILRLSKTFWKNTSDLSKKKWIMTHDCYLKQWQLTFPRIMSYNVILLDEAQDCTACMRDILNRQQPHASLVYVGDSHQQIYGFRLANDALAAVLPTHTYYLTQSFRFGPEIAQVADCILRTFKFGDLSNGRDPDHQSVAVSDKTLLGVGGPGVVSGDEVGGQVAVLCRTNLGVIKKVLSSLESQPERSVAIVGGAGKLGLGIISDLYALSKPPMERVRLNLSVKSRDLQRYSSLKQAKEEANATDDELLLSKIEIVNAIGDGIPDAIEKLKGLPEALESANMIVSTVHKAKGLEFDTVVLFDDFAQRLMTTIESKRHLSKFQKEEANLLYVAVTRAKRSLIFSPTLVSLLNLNKLHFLKPTLTTSLFETDGDQANVFCVRCKKILKTETVLTLLQPKISQMQEPGPLCPSCGSSAAPGWGSLLDNPESRPNVISSVFHAISSRLLAFLK